MHLGMASEHNQDFRGEDIMAIEKKSLLSGSPAARPTASLLATTKTVNNKVIAGRALTAKAGLTPAKAGLTPAKAGLTPAKAGLTPAKAGLTPAKAGLTPAKAGLTPAKVAF